MYYTNNNISKEYDEYEEFREKKNKNQNNIKNFRKQYKNVDTYDNEENFDEKIKYKNADLNIYSNKSNNKKTKK